jgi:hypothetical protein
MKHLIIFLLFSGSVLTTLAQTTDSTTTTMRHDSTMVMDTAKSEMNHTDSSMTNTTSAGMDTMKSMNHTDSSVTNTMSSGMDTTKAAVNNASSNMTNMSSDTSKTSMSNMSSNSSSSMDKNAAMTALNHNAALPVLENYIPDAVVAKAKEKYGDSLYDITSIKRTADQSVYAVRTRSNGVFSLQMIGEDGNPVQ